VPSVEECEAINLNGIHLGDYIPWDTEKQVEFIKREYGWHGTQVEGAYKDYKSVECSMAGIHDFLCYLKRGYGRASIQASGDIRDGLITREQGFELAEKYEQIEPESLKYFLEAAGMTKEEMLEKISALQSEKIYNTKITTDQEWRDIPEAGKPFMQRLVDGEI
jgi:hypothetical protein